MLNGFESFVMTCLGMHRLQPRMHLFADLLRQLVPVNLEALVCMKQLEFAVLSRRTGLTCLPGPRGAVLSSIVICTFGRYSSTVLQMCCKFARALKFAGALGLTIASNKYCKPACMCISTALVATDLWLPQRHICQTAY